MKNLHKTTCLLTALLIFTSAGCKGAKNNSAQTGSGLSTKVSIAKNRTPVVMTLENNVASFDSMTQFFKPDYATESPEQSEETDGASGSKDQSAKGKKSSKSTTQVIPGLRKLSDYITSYSSEKKRFALPETKKAVSQKEEDYSDRPLTVEDWGPKTSVVSEAQNPSFYVIFSVPVRSLTSLDTAESAAAIMSVEPPLKGSYHWYGTQHISFEAEEAADPSTVYTITVKPELTSIYGDKITGETTFKTKAEPVEIQNIYGGYIKEKDCAYDNTTGALPPYENRVFVRTNYLLTADALADRLELFIGSQQLTRGDFTVEGDFTNKSFSWWRNEPECDVQKNKTNSFVVTINAEVPHNTIITVKSADDTRKFTYKTLQPFNSVEVPDYTEYTREKLGNPLRIRLTQTVDPQMVVDFVQVRTKDGTVLPLTKDNVIVNGCYLTIHSLPLELDTEYRLYFMKGFKDIYGQIYSDGQYNYYSDFRTRPVKAYVKYLDYGSKMMEAQFPHKLLYEHQNINAGSWYSISGVQNPLYTNEQGIAGGNKNMIFNGVKNQRQFEEINLDDYLTNGYGFVRFDAATYYTTVNYYGELVEKNDKNILTVQVTDLGITTRMGINRAVVMVHSLSTDKPVDNADVYILHDINDFTDDPLNHIIAQGKTDENGLAVINYTEEQIQAYERNENYRYNYNDNICVYVSKGDDKAVFVPTSHNSWRDGVTTSNRQAARKPIQRTFMFVDRGVYRPGETVTFRGIDRDQVLGSLIVHQGGYTITPQEGWWKGQPIADPITGTLSQSGGFYGSFKIPDDQEPGTYTIRYRRDDAKDEYDYESVYFKIAEFERVKSTASITIPQVTYYSGDTLSAELFAEYLAGGALSGAGYESTWYKQALNMSFNTPDTKGYSFGPDLYSYRSYYSEADGKLNAEGKATLTCNSEKITDGTAYQYRVEAAVTDVSNQRVATQSQVIVHPAKFYVGLKSSKSGGGFAKKDNKLEFNYLLTDINGELLENAAKKAASVKYTLTREEWTMVHEQSVDNTLYTRYERQDVEEAAGDIEIKQKGKFEITPVNSGWYTLKLTGTDTDGNTVVTESSFYVTGGSSYRYNNYNSEAINLTPDQSQYNPGDIAQVLMESPLPAGDYLITVEREGIFTEEIRHFDSPANVIEIPIATNYVPVIYVAVSSYSVRNGAPVHEYGEPDLDKPKGYFGVTPLFVNPYVRAFSVKVESDKPTYKPGETATLTLTATKGGKPVSNAELTVMAVDRGVLDLINYHVPNPIEYYYTSYNYPLRVRGGDSRALLMDPVSYSIKDLLGGDASEEEKDEDDERKDFRPTAVFEPVVMTDKDGKATITFKLPDSLTTYRVTAFGVKDDLFALQEDEFAVQNPINVQQVQPRKLRERDTAECGVLITNLDSEGHEITVSLEARTPTKNTAQDVREGRITVPGTAVVDGESKHKVWVAAGESTVVYFDVAAQKQGTVELVYTISSDLLNEKLNSPVKIEKTFTYETVATYGTLDDDKKSKQSEIEQLAIPGFAKEGRGDLSFTIDATRLGMLGGAVNYLFDYPYGCLEQQSSAVLPLIAFGEYIDVFGLDSKIADINKCVKSYIFGWGKYQLEDGGFPYWPGGTYSSLYVSMRMAYIYVLGLQRGYTMDDFGYSLPKLLDYIYNNANLYDSYSYDYLKAYAAYIFALAGDNRMNAAMENLYTKRDNLNLSTQALLALAYEKLGQAGDRTAQSNAKALATAIRNYLQIDGRTVTVLRKTRTDMWDWYNSDSEQMALILQLFTTINPKDSMVDRLIYTLLQNQSHGYWNNTATTSRVLEAIYTYIQMRELDKTDYSASVTLSGKQILNSNFKGADAKPVTLKLPFEDEIVAALEKDTPQEVTFERNGKGTLYYTIEMRYAIPDENIYTRDEGLKVEYTIIDAETGDVVNKANESDSLLKLVSGKTYKASIKLSSSKARDYVAMRAPIPSGAEILDSSLVTTGTVEEESSWGSWGHWLTNKTIHDNEIRFFWDEFSSGATTVNFTFRAARRGVYPVPPVQAECMYEPENFGRSDGYLCVIE